MRSIVRLLGDNHNRLIVDYMTKVYGIRKIEHHGAFDHDRAIRQIKQLLFELLQRIIVSFRKHQLYAELVAKRHFADSLSHTAETDGKGRDDALIFDTVRNKIVILFELLYVWCIILIMSMFY